MHPGEERRAHEYQTEPTCGGILGVNLSTPHKGVGPASATLWGVLQRRLYAGVNAAATATDGSADATLLSEGFLDLPRRSRIEFSAMAEPRRPVAGELKLSVP